MKSFFKYVFATIIALFLFVALSFVLLFAVLGSIIPSKEEISDNSVLKIDLNKEILERESNDLLSHLKPFTRPESGTIGLLELRKAIKEAATNKKVKGILLKVDNLHAGFATLEEIRNELIKFKKSELCQS